jgi:hypothetical protein
MHVLKERYVKKCGKDICGSELYTLVVSFYSKHNIFSKIITTEIGLLKQNPRYCEFAVVSLLLLLMSVKMAPYWGKGGIM